MRRSVSFLLVGTGVFGLVLAVLLPTWIHDRIAVVPLDRDTTATLTGRALKALVVTDRGEGPKPEIRENVDLTVTAHVQANFSRPEMYQGSPVAVWLEAIQMRDAADDTLIFASKRQVCFNRDDATGFDPRLAGSEADCALDASFLAEPSERGPSTPGQPAEEVRVPRGQMGQNFKYPYGVTPGEYSVHDPYLRRPVTAEYSGTEVFNGVRVYRFDLRSEPTQLGTRPVPGALLGLPEETVNAEHLHQNNVIHWVEPTTGVIVNQRQSMRQELRAPDQPGGTVVFDGTFGYDDATIDAALAEALALRDGLRFLTSTGPIIFGVGGGLLTTIGVLLIIRRHRRDRAEHAGDVLIPAHREPAPDDTPTSVDLPPVTPNVPPGPRVPGAIGTPLHAEHPPLPIRRALGRPRVDHPHVQRQAGAPSPQVPAQNHHQVPRREFP